MDVTGTKPTEQEITDCVTDIRYLLKEYDLILGHEDGEGCFYFERRSSNTQNTVDKFDSWLASANIR